MQKRNSQNLSGSTASSPLPGTPTSLPTRLKKTNPAKNTSSSESLEKDPNTKDVVSIEPSPVSLTGKFDRSAAARAGRRWIADNVRADWTWTQRQSEDSPSPSRTADHSRPDAWVERTMNMSDEEDIDDTEDYTEIRAQKRRRVLEKWTALEEEAKWNEGLAYFDERRNAWTGARLSTSRQLRGTTVESSSLSPIRRVAQTNTNANGDSNGGGGSGSSSASSTPPLATATHPQAKPPPRIALIPIYPRIMSDNPLRQNISTPVLNTLIYNRMVVQGQTPSIPLNLAHLTQVMVQGWKESDEWPPKGAGEPGGPPLDPLVGRKKKGVRGTVRRVIRVLGGKGPEDLAREKVEEARVREQLGVLDAVLGEEDGSGL